MIKRFVVSLNAEWDGGLEKVPFDLSVLNIETMQKIEFTINLNPKLDRIKLLKKVRKKLVKLGVVKKFEVVRINGTIVWL